MSIEAGGKHLLIYGPPGSGKTTVAREICREAHLNYISVGQVTRQEITQKTALGMNLATYLNRVIEYPPELVAEAMAPHLVSSAKQGFLLDGYPKYEVEVPSFLGILESGNFSIDKVLVMELGYPEAQARVLERGICTQCGSQTKKSEIRCVCGGMLDTREDDLPESFRRRFDDHSTTIENTLGRLREGIPSLSISIIEARKSPPEVLKEVRLAIASRPGSSAERACA